MSTTSALDGLIYGYRVVIADDVEAVSRSKLRFLSGITLADNPELGTTDVTVPEGPAGADGAPGAAGAAGATGAAGTPGGPSAVVVTSGTTYTILAADAGKYRRLTSTSAKTITVGPNSGEALSTDYEQHFDNDGAGDATFVAGGGVTIKVPYNGTLVVPPNGVATLKRLTTDVFRLIGVTVPA